MQGRLILIHFFHILGSSEKKKKDFPIPLAFFGVSIFLYHETCFIVCKYFTHCVMHSTIKLVLNEHVGFLQIQPHFLSETPVFAHLCTRH